MKTELFKGNGAECMVQFIKDGCNGNVVAETESGIGIVMVSKKSWEKVNMMCTHPLDWLAESCTYYPPEPVYRNATPGEAMDAWLAGRTIQRRANADDSVANGEWYDIGAKYSDMPFSRWSATETEYRIKEE